MHVLFDFFIRLSLLPFDDMQNGAQLANAVSLQDHNFADELPRRRSRGDVVRLDSRNRHAVDTLTTNDLTP